MKTTSCLLFLHDKLFNILQFFLNIPLQRKNHAGRLYTLFKIMNENNGKMSLYISKKADELKHMRNDQTFDNGDKLCLLQPFLTHLYHINTV